MFCVQRKSSVYRSKNQEKVLCRSHVAVCSQELAVKNESGLHENPLKISWLEGQPEASVPASQQFTSSQVTATTQRTHGCKSLVKHVRPEFQNLPMRPRRPTQIPLSKQRLPERCKPCEGFYFPISGAKYCPRCLCCSALAQNAVFGLNGPQFICFGVVRRWPGTGPKPLVGTLVSGPDPGDPGNSPRGSHRNTDHGGPVIPRLYSLFIQTFCVLFPPFFNRKYSAFQSLSHFLEVGGCGFAF